jgi:NDP-sugar pyrophosphorylase family protein
MAQTTPKALMPVSGEPFILHQLRLLASQGLTSCVVCVGHLGEQIRATVGDSRFGVEVRYSADAPGLDGTLGAIRRAAASLGERFLVMYGDTFLRVDFLAFYRGWIRSNLPAGMVVLHNEGQWGPSNAIFEGDRVRVYDKASPSPVMEWIDYGLGALNTSCLGEVPVEERDLATLYHKLSISGRLFGFEATERFYEIGTPDGLQEASLFLGTLGNSGGSTRRPRP